MAEAGETQRKLESLIKEALNPTQMEVEDFSDGCGYKFKCLIVSDSFEGRALIERHRMVHAALGSLMDTIHALTLKTYTRDQYEKINKV